MQAKRTQTLLLVLMASLALTTASASARTYEVVSCDATGGINHAWTPDFGDRELTVGRQHCPAFGSSDGLMVRSTTVDRAVPNGFGSAWRFDAPLGTTITGVDWAGEYSTYGPGWSAQLQSSRGRVLGCGPSSAACVRKWSTGSLPLHRTVGGAAWLRAAVDCSASNCRGGDGRTRPNAMISTWYSRVQINDPDGPSLKVSGEPWSAAWVKPGARVQISATDASGIAQIRVLRDGSPTNSAAQSCDFTKPRPCEDRSADLGIDRLDAGSPGQAEYSVEAVDAAGNRTRVSRTIGVDGTAPESSDATVEGGEGWRLTPAFSLLWSTAQPAGQAPVTSSRIDVCRAAAVTPECLPARAVPADPSGEASLMVRVPSRGEWEARVTMTDAAGNVGSASLVAAKLRFDDLAPAAPLIDGPAGWVTRERARMISVRPRTVKDSLFPSGVLGWSWALGGEPGININLAAADEGIPLGDMPEGVSDLRLRAISGAGVASKMTTSVKLRIDETPPVATLSGAQAEWQRVPVSLSVLGRDQATLSGMGAGDDSHAAARLWVDGGLVASEAGDAAQNLIDIDGVHRVSAEVTDAAGNRSGRVDGTVRLDSTPPERVVFLPQDAVDPRVVRVDVGDTTSGVAAVKVRMRPIVGGDWRDLQMELRGSRAVGLIEDRGLAAGVWEMEATAFDVAGNQTTTDRNVVHDPALVTLPLRGPSSIEARMGDTAGATATPASLFTLRHGSGSVVTGRLLDRDGLPVAAGLLSLDASISATGSGWQAVSTAVTDHAGRFHFSLAAGPGRRVRVSYAGNRRDLATSTEMQIKVPAMTTLGMSPRVVRVGARAVFSGVLDGGWIPSGGKLVIVQAAIPKRGWQTFGVARAGADGRWQLPYSFRAAVGRVNYSIRAVVPGESAYPYSAVTSATIRVTAVG